MLTEDAPVMNVSIRGTEVMMNKQSGNCVWIITSPSHTRMNVQFSGITASSPFCKPDNFVLADGRCSQLLVAHSLAWKGTRIHVWGRGPVLKMGTVIFLHAEYKFEGNPSG